MEKVLITGTGAIATNLALELAKEGFDIAFLSTSKQEHKGFKCYQWNTEKIDHKALDDVNHIVHLAGSGIADKNWTSSRKKELISSRVATLDVLLKAIEERSIRLNSFTSASGIGFYGAYTKDHIYSERDEPGNDFVSEICIKWENAANRFNQVAEKVTILRTGVVLDKESGALPRLLKPVKMGFGAAIGKGNQYMPWIHMKDIVGIYKAAIKNDSLQGIYNACISDETTNTSFNKELAEVLNKKLWLPNVPAFLMKLMFGEMADILLYGSRVSNEKIKDAGFNFKYENLENALEDILAKN